MKRKTSKIAAVLMIGTVFLSSNAYAKSFNDVKKTGSYGWAYSSVDRLSDKKVFGGYPDGTFKPERPVSFLEIMQVIKNVKNPSAEELKEANKAFSKTTKKYNVASWAEEAVNYNLYKNIITEKTLESASKRGFLKTTGQVFPDRNSVTVYFGRAFGLSGTGNSSSLKHKDVDKIPKMTKGYLSELVDANIYSATGSDGYFNGKKYIRRAEVAVIADKGLNYLENKPVENIEDKVETGDLTAGLVDDIKVVEGKITYISLSGEESTIKIDNNKYKIRLNSVLFKDETGKYNGDILSLENATVKAEVKEDEVIKLNILNIDDSKNKNDNNGVIIEEPKNDTQTESLVPENGHTTSNDEHSFRISGRVLSSKPKRDGYEVEVYVIVSDTREFVAGQQIVVDSNREYSENEIVSIKGTEVNVETKELRII